MGLFADAVGRVLDAIQEGERIYAVRDSTAGNAVDAKWNPLRLNATGGLFVSVDRAATGTTLSVFTQTIGASAVALATHAFPKGFMLQNPTTNTVSIRIGGSGVTGTTGIQIVKGSELPLDDLPTTAGLYAIAESDSAVLIIYGVT